MPNGNYRPVSERREAFYKSLNYIWDTLGCTGDSSCGYIFVVFETEILRNETERDKRYQKVSPSPHETGQTIKQ